ncbi:MAG: WYL domain-containing protein [Coriobacteriales bacterium]|jgi:predicted DNA-binding transcriptional regulator YafY|nr:WYL domain-containing protein [Coriobacteriales bacterium]
MYTIPPKKMLIINILDILRKHTDSEHRLTQKQIVDILADEYQMTVDRKSVKRNLMNLIDFGYEIEYTENKRAARDGSDEVMATDWFIHREFEDSELRLLIDSLMFSNQIPSSQRRQLIEKLKGLSNRYFSARVSHVASLPEVKNTNRQLFYTVEVLDEAISSNHQVAFKYGSFDASGQLLPRRDEEGQDRIYTVDPYQLVATNGRYYLICHDQRHGETLANFRVDRILDVRVLQTSALPLCQLPGYRNGLDLPKHMAEHVYMFAGPTVKVRFKVADEALSHVFDWFGGDVSVAGCGRRGAGEPGVSVVTLQVNEQAMLYWALQFCSYVEVLEPASLRQSLQEAGADLARKYSQEPESPRRKVARK